MYMHKTIKYFQDISILENVEWLENERSDPIPSKHDMLSWIKESISGNDNENEYNFCDPKIKENVVHAKVFIP